MNCTSTRGFARRAAVAAAALPFSERDSNAMSKPLAAKAAEAGVAVKDDQALLDEVTGLVEWPVVLMGAIDPAFMDVPPEVLTTSMRMMYFAIL